MFYITSFHDEWNNYSLAKQSKETLFPELGSLYIVVNDLRSHQKAFQLEIISVSLIAIRMQQRGSLFATEQNWAFLLSDTKSIFKPKGSM